MLINLTQAQREMLDHIVSKGYAYRVKNGWNIPGKVGRFQLSTGEILLALKLVKTKAGRGSLKMVATELGKSIRGGSNE